MSAPIFGRRRGGRPKGPLTRAILALIATHPGIGQSDLIDRLAPLMPPARTAVRQRLHMLLRSPAVTVEVVREGWQYYPRGYPVPAPGRPWTPPPARATPSHAPEPIGGDGLTDRERYRAEKAKRAGRVNPALELARASFQRMEAGGARSARGHRQGPPIDVRRGSEA